MLRFITSFTTIKKKKKKKSRPKLQGQLSAWFWKWEEIVWTLWLQPSNSKPLPSVTQSWESVKASSSRSEFQLITLSSAPAPRSGNKAFTFIYSKNQDLSLDFTPVLFICSRRNSLQMFVPCVERSLTSLASTFAFSFFYPLIFVASCGIADNTRKSSFISLTSIFFTKTLVTKHWVKS